MLNSTETFPATPTKGRWKYQAPCRSPKIPPSTHTYNGPLIMSPFPFQNVPKVICPFGLHLHIRMAPGDSFPPGMECPAVVPTECWGVTEGSMEGYRAEQAKKVCPEREWTTDVCAHSWFLSVQNLPFWMAPVGRASLSGVPVCRASPPT